MMLLHGEERTSFCSQLRTVVDCHTQRTCATFIDQILKDKKRFSHPQEEHDVDKFHDDDHFNNALDDDDNFQNALYDDHHS